MALTMSSALLAAAAIVAVAVALCLTLRRGGTGRPAAAPCATSDPAEGPDRYRALFDGAREGLCVLRDGRIRVANQSFARMLGHRRDDLIGQEVNDLVSPQDRDAARGILLGVRVAIPRAIRMQTRHRGPRWFEIGGRPIEWDGQPATLVFLDDIHARHIAGERIRDLAFHDPLTGLPNRRAFMRDLTVAIRQQAREGFWGCVLFGDLDGFKALNDRHGHDAGDHLLGQVTRRLQARVRHADTVARFGGDEFVLLLASLDGERERAREQVARIAEGILASVAQPCALPVTGGERVEYACAMSIGAVLFLDAPGREREILKAADEAMYRAKQLGGNRLVFGDPVARASAAYGRVSPDVPCR